jgi:hypothetical protein
VDDDAHRVPLLLQIAPVDLPASNPNPNPVPSLRLEPHLIEDEFGLFALFHAAVGFDLEVGEEVGRSFEVFG